MNISTLGLGTVKFGRNQGVKYPESFSLPDNKTILELLALTQDLGINLLDTAPAYGNSECRLGELLGKNNKDWIIMSKAGEEFVDGESQYAFTPKFIRQSVERSLKRLQRDYLDILLIHSDGNDMQIIESDDVFGTLDQLKQQGLIRMGGMSTKTIDGGISSLEHADCVMATYNPSYLDEKPVLDRAHEFGKPVFIKKAFCSGHLDKIGNKNPIETSMQLILEHPADNHIIFGTLNPVHLKENVSICESLIKSLA